MYRLWVRHAVWLACAQTHSRARLHAAPGAAARTAPDSSTHSSSAAAAAEPGLEAWRAQRGCGPSGVTSTGPALADSACSAQGTSSAWASAAAAPSAVGDAAALQKDS